MDWRKEIAAGEFVAGRENQAGPDFATGPADVASQGAATEEMLRTSIKAPPLDFSVRCTYDSRPPNGFDFNFSALLAVTAPSAAGVAVTFQCPAGYRAVPLEWEMVWDNPPGGLFKNTFVTWLNNNVPVPYNTGVFVGGAGTGARPLKTFYVVEEQTTFGIVVSVTGVVGTFSGGINVYGNLIPVTDVSLPFAVTNPDKPIR